MDGTKYKSVLGMNLCILLEISVALTLSHHFPIIILNKKHEENPQPNPIFIAQ
jgi:hypothetical protein